MTEILQEFTGAVVGLFLESAPYLLFGFVIAGLLKVWMPADRVTRWVGKDDFASVARASFLGIPLPLCSCSVLPTAAALRKNGASKGATTSFLVSTPETGVDSVAITYALLGPVMMVVRPVAALITALTAGTLVNLFVRKGDGEGGGATATASDACEGDASGVDGESGGEAASCHPGEVEAERDAGELEESGAASPGAGWLGRSWEGVRWAATKLLDDLTPWLVLGFLISGLIAVLLPTDLFDERIPGWLNGWVPAGVLSALLMLIIGTPMYVCAAAATPLAAAMMAKGLDPGAALVFLLVGPATNATTFTVVHKILGRRLLLVYLGSVLAVALAGAAVVNTFFEIPPPSADIMEHGAGTAWWVYALAALLALGMFASARRIRMLSQWGEALRAAGRPIGIDVTGRRARFGGVAVGLGLWLSTAASSVAPGEHGWTMRFGEVRGEAAEPGLVWHLPWPFEWVQTLRVDEVRGVDVGFGREETAAEGSRELEARYLDEAEVLTGDENLLSVKFAVHYSVKDPHRFQFGLSDADELVKAFAESVLRRVVGTETADSLLVELRDELAASAWAELQRELDAVDAGIEVQRFNLCDVHASREAHWDFRAVASALEDKERVIHEARAYEIEALANGQMEAHTLRTRAAGSARETEAKAAGRATAFRAQSEAFRAHESVSRIRMRIEAEEAAISRTSAVFLLGEGVEVESRLVDLPPRATIGAGQEEGRLPPVDGREWEDPGFPPRDR